MQPWPLLSFARVRATLEKAGCQCQLVFPAGAALALDGTPTPAIYAFTRSIPGREELFATMVAIDDEDLIPYDDARSACDALELDLGLFGPIH